MIQLDEQPHLSPGRRRRLQELTLALGENSSRDIAALIRDQLSIDLSTYYGGLPIPHPFGKGSGQLSSKIAQVREDAEAGLAFVVLKTVIAESMTGERSMDEWANPETKMQVEHRVSQRGRNGWNVTWKGRGWPGSLRSYCDFFDSALRCGAEGGLRVIPSVKYHLPSSGQTHRAEEYEYTTKELQRVWNLYVSSPLLIEKDLSPTLAGDARSADRTVVLDWLANLTTWIRRVEDVKLGIKVMNAVYDDAFQLDMLRTLAQDESKPDFLVVFNRLFDTKRSVAYGGWDLSDRNLRVLENARETGALSIPLSGTGNICSGRMMVEYALRGCENGQVHTFFQLPRSQYMISRGSRSHCALITLLLDPTHGLVPWLWSLNESGHLAPKDGVLHFRDIVGNGIR